MSRLPVTSFLMAALLAVPAGPAVAKPVPAPPNAPPSTAVTEAIVDAVAVEMNRAINELKVPNAPPPYFIAYKITEVEVNDVVASLGSTTARRDRHFVNIEARVNVGNYDFDNRNFVVAGAEGVDGSASIVLPIEATPRIAQRAAWLVTDAAYKEALDQLLTKFNARRAGGVAKSDVPSFTKEKPWVREDQVPVAALEDLDAMEKRAQKVSAIFREQDEIRDSRVAFTSYLERRWYLNTEGTTVTDTRRASGVLIEAQGQAEDGQDVFQYYSKYGITQADLPDDDALVKQAQSLAKGVVDLRKAPIMGRYSGPVLFEGEGAIGMVRATLAPNLGGTPLPEGLPPAQARTFGGALTDKVGLRVLAPFLSIVDDPTENRFEGKGLIGGYQVDDEGVASQKVDVVKDGTLQTLLTSRTPSNKDAKSNGHARRTAPGGIFHGSATNLILKAKKGMAQKALEAKLIAEIKAQKLPFGLIVQQFDDPAITSVPDLTKRELVQLYKSADPDMPPPTLIAYKVYPTGKRELVRGVQLRPVPIQAWKDVLAAGNNMTVFNLLANSDSFAEQRLGGIDIGAVPSSGVESAIVAPDLLFRELDVVGNNSGLRDAPAVPRPASVK
jgi:hypothetical protein